MYLMLSEASWEEQLKDCSLTACGAALSQVSPNWHWSGLAPRWGPGQVQIPGFEWFVFATI